MRIDRRPSAAARARVRELVLELGWNSTAYQLLNPGLCYAFDRTGDAVTGFVEVGGWWIVAGAPVARLERLAAVVDDLERAARAAGASVAYFGAEARLEAVLAERPGRSLLRLGAQPFLDPGAWTGTLSRRASLRGQLARARNKGLSVEEWPVAMAAEHPVLVRCLGDWLERRGLPPLEFLTTARTLGRLGDRRVFVAQRSGKVVGFLVMSPVPARGLALLEQNVRTASAPNGTAEMLIDAALLAAAGQFRTVSLGLAPLSDRGLIAAGPPPAWWLGALRRWSRAHGRRFYNFRGLEAFKAKFGPSSWESVWLLADRPTIGPGLLWAVVGAFAGGHPARFATRALVRAAKRELKSALDAG